MVGVGAAGAIVFRRKSRNRQALESGEILPGSSRDSGNRWAFLPFGRRSSPTDMAAAADLAASGVTNPVGPRRPKPGMVIAGGQAQPGSGIVTALYNHQASEPGELEFRKGDKITVTRRDDSGWWEGRTTNGKKGIFPANYCST